MEQELEKYRLLEKAYLIYICRYELQPGDPVPIAGNLYQQRVDGEGVLEVMQELDPHMTYEAIKKLLEMLPGKLRPLPDPNIAKHVDTQRIGGVWVSWLMGEPWTITFKKPTFLKPKEWGEILSRCTI